MKTQEYKVGDFVEVTKLDIEVSGEIVAVENTSKGVRYRVSHCYGTLYAKPEEVTKVVYEID